jgi:hypothetical protein
LSLKEVDSAQYADVDWRAAMDDLEEEALEGIEFTPADEGPAESEAEKAPEATNEGDVEVQAELPLEAEAESPEPDDQAEPENSAE